MMTGRHPRFRYQPPLDTDALQTDVMRFMAIIGLCLAALFALVQGLPGNREQTISPNDSQIEIERQLADLKDRLDASNQTLRGTKARLDDVSLENMELKRQQVTDRTKRMEAKAESVEQPPSTRERQRPDSTDTSRSAEEVPLQTPPGVAPEDGQTLSRAPEKEQGFVLMFASEQALDGLLRRGHIRFVALREDEAWLLSVTGRALAYRKHDLPGRFHEMSPGTVPEQYIRAFSRGAGRPAVRDMVWAVVLPPAIEQRVHELMVASQGGVLVIQSDGSVKLTGEGR